MGVSSSPAQVRGFVARFPLSRVGWLALLAAAMTVGLIAYGSWVRVSGSGLGCPDWPLCDRSVVPAGRAATIESGHRWFAAVTTVTVFAAAILAFVRRREAPGPAKLLAAAAGMILAQAVLGGIVVLTDVHAYIRLVHLAIAMSIIALLTFGGIGMLRRGGWGFSPTASPRQTRRGWHLPLAGAAVIMMGASIVATQTSFDCSHLPLCDGAPAMATWLHGLHRVLGVVLFLGLAVTVWRLQRTSVRGPLMTVAALTLLALVGQLALGATAVTHDFPSGLRILHVGLAAVIWWGLVATWALSCYPAQPLPARS